MARLSIALGLLLIGCSDPPGELVDASRPDLEPRDGGVDCGWHPEAMTDADGDGIVWLLEANASDDIDGDGLENDEDPDSDGDGISDREESGQESICDFPIDSDEDGHADFLDVDSDNDGASDGVEVEAGLDRLSRDSDGDGCQDAVQLAVGECAPSDLIFEPCESTVPRAQSVVVTWDGTETLDSVRIAFVDETGMSVEPPARVRTSFLIPADGAVPGEESFSDVRPGVRLGFELTHDTFRDWGPFERFRWTAVAPASGMVLGGGRLFVAGQDPCIARRF